MDAELIFGFFLFARKFVPVEKKDLISAISNIKKHFQDRNRRARNNLK